MTTLQSQTLINKSSNTLLKDFANSKNSFYIQVMGEEDEAEVDISKPYWAIEPIDGTWAFITHENTSAINLSLIDNEEVVLGIVFNPFTDEFFHTKKGSESYIGMLKLPLRENKS
jgi:fructose-1,6-bisphosphatase/inositol monophosphatase family enzyme